MFLEAQEAPGWSLRTEYYVKVTTLILLPLQAQLLKPRFAGFATDSLDDWQRDQRLLLFSDSLLV